MSQLNFTGAAIAAAVLLLATMGTAMSRTLSPAEVSALRQGAYPAPSEKWLPAGELAQRLGQENNDDAIPLLLELRDPALLNRFARAFTGPPAPATEELIVRLRRDPAVGGELLKLATGYRSRTLFDALLVDIRDGIAAVLAGRPGQFPNHIFAINAIVRTDMPGIEPELTELLPHLRPDLGRPVARLLVKRHYLPAQNALVELLRRTPPGQQLGSVAYEVSGLETQGILDGLAARLAELRGLPPSPPPEGPGGPGSAGWTSDQLARVRLREQNAELLTLVRVIEGATPALKLDRSLFVPAVVGEFAPEHRASVLRMLSLRAEQESAAADITPDNFSHWARAPDRISQLKHFIARGAPLDAADRSGDTPLLAAVKRLNVEAVRLLLEAGANRNVRDAEGVTALHLAARRQGPSDEPWLTMARLLVAGKADLTATAGAGATPLHTAIDFKFGKMARLLVESGADVNAQASDHGLQD